MIVARDASTKSNKGWPWRVNSPSGDVLQCKKSAKAETHVKTPLNELNGLGLYCKRDDARSSARSGCQVKSQVSQAKAHC
mgnify:CR=1